MCRTAIIPRHASHRGPANLLCLASLALPNGAKPIGIQLHTDGTALHGHVAVLEIPD